MESHIQKNQYKYLNKHILLDDLEFTQAINRKLNKRVENLQQELESMGKQNLDLKNAFNQQLSPEEKHAVHISIQESRILMKLISTTKRAKYLAHTCALLRAELNEIKGESPYSLTPQPPPLTFENPTPDSSLPTLTSENPTPDSSLPTSQFTITEDKLFS